jgi:hypothetical protein
VKSDQGTRQGPPTILNTEQSTSPRPRIEHLQQAIAFVGEGRGDLVPVWYLHLLRGMIDGALARHRPRVT